MPCYARATPTRPTGPLLLTVADYIAMVGDVDQARACLEELERKGRIVDRLGAAHLSFPTWTRVAEDD